MLFSPSVSLRPPFAVIPPGRPRRIALLVGFALFLAVSAWMNPSTNALVGPGTELAIVSLELAATPAQATTVLELWQARGALPAAATNVHVDYVFLLVYAATLALAAGMASDVLRAHPRTARLGVILAWGALAAGLFDAVENVGLLIMLADPAHVSGFASWLAAAFATPKFVLVILALLYAAMGAIAWLLTRARSRQGAPVR